MAWHRGVVPSRRDPAFSPKQAPVTYNTVRDHRAPEQQRKIQQKIQTAATGWAGCARRGQLEHGRSARGRPWRARGSRAACGRGRGGCRMRSASRGSRQISLVPLSWHTATLPSRLDPVFFSQQANSPYNTIWDHRATEKPRTNQQKIQTATGGGERTSGRRERGRSAHRRAWRAMAPATSVEGAAGGWSALGDFGFETE